VLGSLVSIDYLPGIRDLIVIFQIWSPANVVFSGIGVLLSVSIMLDLPVSAIMTLACLGGKRCRCEPRCTHRHLRAHRGVFQASRGIHRSSANCCDD
jgi:hypothetical protein